MSAADKAKEIVQDLTGMWWPDADEDALRDAAKAWRDFADDVEDVLTAANRAARSLIEHNRGEAISAFDDPFWRRYHHEKHGWLQDLIDGARAMGKALDKYADAVRDAVKKLEHELMIVGATIVAGTALAIFTAGISEGAALAAAATIVELAGSLGVAVSAEVATIAGTTLATAAFAGIESVTVDLAVAQPLAIATGEQKGGLNLDEASKAGMYGMAYGGMFGAGAGTVRAASNAGGFGGLFDGLLLPRPQMPTPTALDSTVPAVPKLIRQDDDFAATHNPGGLRKSRFDPDLGIVPANPDGEITPLQHVLGGKNKAAKESSQYTSFAPEDGTGKVYGREEVRVDYLRLQKDIDAGRVSGVEILSPEHIQRSINAEIDNVAGRHVEVPATLRADDGADKVSGFVDELGLSKGKSRKVMDRVMAMLNTRRDNEWLISGVVPKDYVTGPFPTARSE